MRKLCPKCYNDYIVLMHIDFKTKYKDTATYSYKCYNCKHVWKEEL